ncbi:sialidase family protein [Kitasatospora sp. NPDC018619]|uniref:sialidase family protein n=1 Tax=unclassified Kitasatospora TaxID=2633591 RepID=UPI003789D2DE
MKHPRTRTPRTSRRRPLAAVAAAALALAGAAWTTGPAAAAPPRPHEARATVSVGSVSVSVSGFGSGSTSASAGADFSLAERPAAAIVDAGSSVTTTVTTAVTAGPAQTVRFSAAGLPVGATAVFGPASAPVGSPAALTVSTAASTPTGSYPITVTGTGPSATRTAVFTLTVNGEGPRLVRVSADPFADAVGQHATAVEPDTFAYGGTVVTSSQVGRFTDGGAADLGWSTSLDGGASWQGGILPGITPHRGGGWARVSDPSVAYDAKHGTWMITGLVIDVPADGAAGVTVSRSADGLDWRSPVRAVGFDGQGYDKEWIVCDNAPTSPYFGTCYIEVDVPTADNLIVMSASRDGGATWSAPTGPSGALGLGGQPLVRPDGRVVVPYSADTTAIRSFTSADGGRSWGSTLLVADVVAHEVAGGLRDGEGLPSAEIDAAGRVFVAWQDCRFRAGCPANDIVYATSTDGTAWSAVTRVPIDATTSGADHFLPGLGVDPTTAGRTAGLGLYYYFYPNADCTDATCRLAVGFVSSTDGGATWSAPRTVAGPMPLSRIAATAGGAMVGDYLSTSVLHGRAVAVFAVGRAPADGQAFDEAMYAVEGGLPVRAGTVPADTGPVAFPPPARERHLPPPVRS